MSNKAKGFTLIELLVVIAIIGILAALVLVALGSARDKANDARVKSTMSQMRTLAEIIYDNNGASYDVAGGGQVGACFSAPNATTCTDATIQANVTTLRSDVNSANGGSNVASYSSAALFCVEAALKSTGFVCVDSTGVTATGHTAAICATGNLKCS